jgi:chromosome segregation ATPase
MQAILTDGPRSVLRRGGIVLIVLAIFSLPGCVPQQADLKQTEKNLPLRIKQSSDESAQTRARQSQEISVLREQELPRLRGDLERALHQVQELQAKQEDVRQRVRNLEEVVGKTERPLEGSVNPPGNEIEARVDTLVEITRSILVQIADLSKRIKRIEKK